MIGIEKDMELYEKLNILSDAAKYDVACTSSGVNRRGDGTGIGNCKESGICHTFSADGRCVSLLKILFTNECIYDCAYCMNRKTNDIKRTSFTPEEVCTLTMQFYRRNYIEGLFLSSGVVQTPNYTMELLYQTVYRLRTQYRFQGYIHVKGIPGASPELIHKIGFYVDRMSVNLELPTADGLQKLAPNKTRAAILKPMKQIQNTIHQNKNDLMTYKQNPRFVPGGQSTQMIIGATQENDYQVMSVTQALYKQFDMKRVFYSAFMNVNGNSELPMTLNGPPLLREHRLYQADWLLRYYQFEVDELLTEERPNFNIYLDPKCDWAVRHLENFPIEVSKADYYSLLRVPGIGAKSARRIIQSRRQGSFGYNDLKKMGVVLKRALYFITCYGKRMYPIRMDEDYICRNLMADCSQIPREIRNAGYRQITLFDDVSHDIVTEEGMIIQ